MAAEERVSLAHLPLDVRRQWYGVALSSDLPQTVKGKFGYKAPSPLATTLLADPIVLWRDLLGNARCLADKCPHRSAPLSLGKINGENGTLECIYHGWQLDGASGKVTHIPALLDGKEIPSNAQSRTYPVCEQDNVVYVWAGPEDSAPSDAAGAGPPPRDVDDEGLPLLEKIGYVCQYICVDLPIDHSLMIENLLDPAHIPFAHEGTIGRRSQAKPLEMKIKKTPRGIRGEVKEGYFNGFEAPCTIVLHTPPKPGKMDMWQYVNCTPSAPGQMRMVYRSYRNWATFVQWIPPLRRMFDSFSAKIVFQDYNLLLGQQMRLREKGLAWNAAIQVDNLPVMYRNYWKRTFGKTDKDSPWWRGWDGSLDVEDLDRLGVFSKDFDCNGCAVPHRPHHPQNSLEVSGRLAPLRPQPAQGYPWLGFLVAAAIGALAAKMF
mmetsp:Transcript_161354/g.518065  ORF Transcript_161354/g.518065 Transcript_161354/m.518065 type:complete len:433 (+) Transcript_161354:157-1455(+)